jgi:hypothetical protein
VAAFIITFQPLTKMYGVEPTVATIETAAEAWAVVQQLEGSDEEIEIKDELGRTISREELRMLAEKEVH